MILTCLFSLSACDDVEQTSEYGYFLAVESVSEKDGEVQVKLILSTAENDNTLDMVKANCFVAVERDGFFYDKAEYIFRLDGESIFSATEDFLALYGTNYAVEDFSSLKIVFDYVTIYKSTKSDGVRLESGKKYVHSFEIENTDNVFVLDRRIAHSSAWYGVTIIATVCAVGAVIAVAVIKRGKYGRKNEERN